jgi:hypothetical protein
MKTNVWNCFFCDYNFDSQNSSLRKEHILICGQKNNVNHETISKMLESCKEVNNQTIEHSTSIVSIDLTSDPSAVDTIEIDDDDDDDDDVVVVKENILNSMNQSVIESPQSNAFNILMEASRNKSHVPSSSSKRARYDHNSFLSPSDSLKSSDSISFEVSLEADLSPQISSKLSGEGQKRPAPFYKKVQFGNMALPIIVDGFLYANRDLSDTYFLTHFHSDHYTGLNSKFSAGELHYYLTD